MDSLRWVDETYVQKHETEDSASLRAPYFAPLSQYSTCSSPHPSSRERHAIKTFLVRYAKRTAVAFLIYVLSFMPLLGRFVLPAASVYTFNNAVGPLPAAIVFGAGLILPKTYIVMFLQSYYSSRSLMRELVSFPSPTMFVFAVSDRDDLLTLEKAHSVLFADKILSRTEASMV